MQYLIKHMNKCWRRNFLSSAHCRIFEDDFDLSAMHLDDNYEFNDRELNLLTQVTESHDNDKVYKKMKIFGRFRATLISERTSNSTKIPPKRLDKNSKVISRIQIECLEKLDAKCEANKNNKTSECITNFTTCTQIA